MIPKIDGSARSLWLGALLGHMVSLYFALFRLFLCCMPTLKLGHYGVKCVYYLGLHVQRRLAGRTYIFCCCTFFFFCDTENYRWESAQQTPADTVPTVGLPAEVIKYPQTFDPCCPLSTGAKCPKFWPKFRPQSLDRGILELGRSIGKQKQTCQGSMIDLPTHQTWSGWVPQLPEPLAQWVPQRVKVENFLYIFRSSGPRRVQRHQCYTTFGAVAAAKRLPWHISQFAPTVHRRVTQKVKVENFLHILRSSGPRRVHRHQCYTTYWGRSWCKKTTVPVSYTHLTLPTNREV